MSYCRFRNTLSDMQDCVEHWEGDELDDGTLDELSLEEKQARENMVEICKEIVRDYGDEE